MIIQPLKGTLGTIIMCGRCPHTIPENSTIEWTDTDGTTYFTGNSVLDLRVFLVAHDSAANETNYVQQSLTRILVKNPAVLVCKCGHGSEMHSFYSATRSECHGMMMVPDLDQESMYETACPCGFYEAKTK